MVSRAAVRAMRELLVRRRETPDHLRGRVRSFDYGLATLSIGASSVAAGLLADAWSAAAATWLLAAIGGGYGVIWLGWSLAALCAR